MIKQLIMLKNWNMMDMEGVYFNGLQFILIKRLWVVSISLGGGHRILAEKNEKLKNETILNKEPAEQLHKLIIRKVK